MVVWDGVIMRMLAIILYGLSFPPLNTTQAYGGKPHSPNTDTRIQRDVG